MTKDDIIALPNEHLRQRSKRVSFVTDEVLKIIDDMQAATIDWENSREHEVGVALAAVQIDQLLRIVVLRNNYEDKSDHSFTVLLNPEITKYEGKIEEDYEGCLSVKNVYGKVPRHTRVRVKANNLQGQEIRLTAEDFLARTLQHEIDHTNGILFVDHIREKKDHFYNLAEDGKLIKLNYDKEIADSLLW